MNGSTPRLRGARFRALGHRAQRAWEWRRDAFFSGGFFLKAALLYRRALSGVIFIGVTGSCGKSTTKELISAVLAKKYRVHRNPGNDNQPPEIAKSLFSMRPGGGQCCVMELSPAGYHGTQIDFSIPLGLVSPLIGVVTNVGSDHISAFGSEDAIAAAKGKLIEVLPKNGIAVLNADDARVLAMRKRCVGRVITYGLATDANVRAENVSSRWPARLSFTLIHDGQSVQVQTQLCGEHWVHSVLAAFAVGIALDMPLLTIAEAVKEAPPFEARLSPVELPNGITFIRDDLKAPLWTISPALQFLREATVQRKIAIIGSISDYEGNSKRSGSVMRQRAYTSVATEALDIADHVIFIGPQATKCLKAKRHPDDDALQAFYSVEAARDYLHDLLQPGDLVLLKGTHRQECLMDVIGIFANETGAEQRANKQPRAAAIIVTPPTAQPKTDDAAQTKPIRAIIGLGNAGEQFRNTRHNVGFHALEAFAQAKGVTWQQSDLGEVAKIERPDRTIHLIKPLTNMNNSGAVVQQWANQLGFEAEECVLVHDDIQLPPGRIRVRAGGGDGGHNGVHSVHQAFQTDTMQRLKIGVGMPEDKAALAEHVVSALSSADLAVMEGAYAKAVEQLSRLLGEAKKRRADADPSPTKDASQQSA